MAPRKDLTVSEWKTEIDSGLKFRRDYGLEDDWVNLEAQFYGVLDPESPGPNITASTGDSLLSALTVPYPKIKVIPLRKEFLRGLLSWSPLITSSSPSLESRNKSNSRVTTHFYGPRVFLR